jgi:hypothetical protein
LRAARLVARHAVLLLFVVLALIPASALAFTPPDPNNPGNHFGEWLHNPHLQQQAPSPTPGGGGGNGGGIQDSFGGQGSSAGVAPNLSGVPSFQFRPAGLGIPALGSALGLGKDSWWVAVLLAALVAANVALGVVWLARGANYVLRRGLRLVPATA